MNEEQIAEFWQNHPCDDEQVGGLCGDSSDSYLNFFDKVDKFRYQQEKHILANLNKIDFKKKSVLEIGLGQGSDSEQIIQRGANWNGLDLTRESVDRVKKRLQLKSLPYGSIIQGTALDIPFPDNNFDIIFSHGVLHHIPEIDTAQKEIARVLKPEGELIIMVYAKWSLNYLVSICLIRRLGLLGLYLLKTNPAGIYGQHLKNAKSYGIGNYLRMSNFIHRNTDGPHNPYAKVYSVKDIQKDFSEFEIVDSYKCFMHAPPLPVKYLLLSRQLGWHIWAHLRLMASETQMGPESQTMT